MRCGVNVIVTSVLNALNLIFAKSSPNMPAERIDWGGRSISAIVGGSPNVLYRAEEETLAIYGTEIS